MLLCSIYPNSYHLDPLTPDMNFQNCTVLFTVLYVFQLQPFSSVLPCEGGRVKRLSNAQRDEQTYKIAKYIVSIRSRWPQIIFGDNHFCTGTIIAPKFVLTVAKCTMRWVSPCCYYKVLLYNALSLFCLSIVVIARCGMWSDRYLLSRAPLID